jgi:hypothetical protein
MPAPVANVPSFMVTSSERLSGVHCISAIHAPFIA